MSQLYSEYSYWPIISKMVVHVVYLLSYFILTKDNNLFLKICTLFSFFYMGLEHICLMFHSYLSLITEFLLSYLKQQVALMFIHDIKTQHCSFRSYMLLYVLSADRVQHVQAWSLWDLKVVLGNGSKGKAKFQTILKIKETPHCNICILLIFIIIIMLYIRVEV